MKIAIVADSSIAVPPIIYGGAESLIALLIDGLVESDQKVDLYSTGDSKTKAQLFYLNLESKVDNSNLIDQNNHYFWAFEQIVQQDYDIVLINHPIGLPFSRMVDCPVLMLVHHPANDSFHRFMIKILNLAHLAI